MPKPKHSLESEKEALTVTLHTFTMCMKREIMEKADLGYRGWDDTKMQQYMKEQISNHLAKGNWVVVANLAMFLDNLEI